MRSSTFTRKIIYVVCIALLLIPLAMISRPDPRTVTAQGLASTDDRGGKLAQLRDEFDLSQAKLMEIDPASETMKLASVGLRGVAVNVLWMQAMEHRKKQQWDQLRSTLNALIKIQPNFIKVWEYQAHNLSYNISVEFDDYEYRYHWVKEGIKFLTEGIPYNYRNHRITDNLGFFTGLKIGRSDEKQQFRRLFRRDDDFHQELFLPGGRGVDPDLYDTREYGHDNWKLAYHWYDKSRALVEKYGQQFLNDMMFYRKRPMQLMNQARGLQEEYPTDDVIQEIWRDANEEWNVYGQRDIRTSRGIPITLEGLAGLQAELAELRDDLDELVPGYRDGYIDEVRDRIGFSEVQLAAMAVPPDERSEEESVIAAEAERILLKRSKGIDGQIAENAGPDDLKAARKLAKSIDEVMEKMQFSESYSETVNYQYWDIRSEAETNPLTVDARRAMFRAEEMKRNSIFDDEYQFENESGDKKLVKQGAISLFDAAFDKWKRVLDEPDYQGTPLDDGEIIDDLIDASGEYYDMLRITGRDWPEDFPFQDYVDQEGSYGEIDLPTSQDVADRLSGSDDGSESEETDDAEGNEAVEDEAANDDADEDSDSDDLESDG